MDQREVVEYIVVWGDSGKELAEEVTNRLGAGWQPWGSAYVATVEVTSDSEDEDEGGTIDTVIYHYQPMVKYFVVPATFVYP